MSTVTRNRDPRSSWKYLKLDRRFPRIVGVPVAPGCSKGGLIEIVRIDILGHVQPAQPGHPQFMQFHRELPRQSGCVMLIHAASGASMEQIPGNSWIEHLSPYGAGTRRRTVDARQFIQADVASQRGLVQAIGRMERSAVNSYTVAGAFVGLLFGVWASNKVIGTDNVEYFFSLAALLATPFTACSWWLISRRYRKAQHRERLFYAVSGWFVLLLCAGAMFVGMAAIFPRSGAA